MIPHFPMDAPQPQGLPPRPKAMVPFLFILLGFVLFPGPSAWAKQDPSSAPAVAPTETATATPWVYNGPKLYSLDAIWGSKGAGDDQLNGPEGIDIAPNGRIVIADSGNNRVSVWEEDGAPYKTFGSFGTSATWRNPPQFNHPTGVYVHPSTKIYVADTQNHRVVVVDDKGLVVSSWGVQGNEKAQFNLPRAIRRDHFGKIWVLDSGNSRFQIFSELGEFSSLWGAFGTEVGALNVPRDFALNFIDQSITADTGNFRMQVFNGQGAPVTSLGWFGDGPAQFREPDGVAIAKNGMIAVTDGFGRVEFFNHRFEFIGQWSAKEEVLTPDYNPRFHGIAADQQNRFYITDNMNGMVLRIRPVFAQETPIQAKATPTPQDNNPYGGVGYPIR